MVNLYFENDKSKYNCSNKEETPLDYLLIAVALCLGHEILEINMKDEFKNVNVRFGSKMIKISCTCREDKKNVFSTVVSSCYILKNLKFETQIDFTIVD